MLWNILPAAGCFLASFCWLFGCLVFAVAVELLRMLFAVANVVEYVLVYVVESFGLYLTSCLLLSGCSRFVFWLRAGCLLSAVALLLPLMLFAVP